MLDCGEDKPDTHWVYYGLNDFSDLRKAQAGFLKEELASRAFKKASKRVLIHHVPSLGKERTMIRIILAGTSGERSLRKHRSLSVSMRILIVSLISLKVLTETTILS